MRVYWPDSSGWIQLGGEGFESSGERGAIGTSGVQSELSLQGLPVHDVGSLPAAPAAAGEHNDRDAPVGSVGSPTDQAVGLHALHQATHARLAVAGTHERTELTESQPARRVGLHQVRERRVGAGVDAGARLERIDDLAEHRLVHVHQRGPQLIGF